MTIKELLINTPLALATDVLKTTGSRAYITISVDSAVFDDLITQLDAPYTNKVMVDVSTRTTFISIGNVTIHRR